MEVVNYTNLKNKLKDYLNIVSKENKKVIITRNKNETPIVMISLKDYNENFINYTPNKKTQQALLKGDYEVVENIEVIWR